MVYPAPPLFRTPRPLRGELLMFGPGMNGCYLFPLLRWHGASLGHLLAELGNGLSASHLISPLLVIVAITAGIRAVVNEYHHASVSPRRELPLAHQFAFVLHPSEDVAAGLRCQVTLGEHERHQVGPRMPLAIPEVRVGQCPVGTAGPLAQLLGVKSLLVHPRSLHPREPLGLKWWGRWGLDTPATLLSASSLAGGAKGATGSASSPRLERWASSVGTEERS